MEVLTTKEAAELLRISTWQLYQLVNEDLIPHQRLGSRIIRFSRKALMDWLAETIDK